MLLEELDDCIHEMNKIKVLEQNANDFQKQEKSDRIFKETVAEALRVVMSVQKAYSEMLFRISAQQKQKLLDLLEACADALGKGQIQEATAIFAQKELKLIKKEIMEEWTVKHRTVTYHKTNMLHNVQGIAPDQSRITIAINKIAMGAKWDFDNDRLDSMQSGIRESDEIIQSLGLTSNEVIEFLNKVSVGKATVMDLTPTVLSWIKEKELSCKLGIAFK